MDNKTELHTVLKALLIAHDLSESELARRTGIGQPVVHRMASGETSNPKMETLRPIANYFGVTINQLIGDEPLPKDRLPVNKSLVNVRTWIRVPLLSWEQANLWPKIEAAEVTDYVSTDLDVGDNSFALILKDSTMAPRFPEGTTIIVDPSYKPVDQDFAVVRLIGQKQVTFKQVLIDGDDVYLKPLNPDFNTVLMDKKGTFLGVMVQARTNYIKRSSNQTNINK